MTPLLSDVSRKIQLKYLLGVLVAYAFVTLPGLLHYPAVWVDEGWVAEVARQCALGYPLGNPSHTELYRYSDRVFWMPHLYFQLLGGWFSLFGVSLESGRCLSLLTGGATTLLLFALLTRGFGSAPALWGVAAFLTDTFVWKAHRTIRFEPTLLLVALLALAAALAALERESTGRRGTGHWIACGLALAALVNIHPNALLLGAAVAAFLIARQGPRLLARPGPWIALGCGVLGAVPFGLFVLSDRAADFVNVLGQNAFHFEGHGAAGPPLTREAARYASYFPFPARLPAALFWLGVVVVATTQARRQAALRPPLAALGALVTGLAFLPNKSLLYLTAAIPACAALLAGLLARPAVPGAPPSWKRLLIGAAALLVLANVVVGAALLSRNTGTHPRRVFAAIAAALEPDDRVAGTFVTWWGAYNHAFRDFQRVRDLADLRAFAPTVVILGDRHWEEARTTVFAAFAPAVEAWLAASSPPPTVIEDPVLGRIRLYRPAAAQ